MKKLIFLLVIICLFVCGCKKDPDTPSEPEVEVSEEEKIMKNVSSQDFGTVVGDYSNRYTIIKVTNNNDSDLYLDVKVTYNDNNNVTDEDDVYVYVGSKKSVYAVSKMYAEDPIFTSYKYDIEFIDKIEGYNDIINNITVNKEKNDKNITVTIGNNGNRTTTARALILYYKDNRIVAVDESVQYNLMPTSIKSETLDLPHKDLKNLIPFDNVDVFINEVSIRL